MRAILRTLAAALLTASAGIGAPAGAQNFDGNTIVKVGAFWQGTQMSIDQVQPAALAGSGTQDGWLHGGVSAGIDVRLPYRWLIGAEIDGSFGDARGLVRGTDYGFDYLFNMRGRVGHYARPDLMLYLTTGVSYLGFEAQEGPGRKAAETVTGWILGAGIEYEWHHVILFGEYNHGWYGSREFTIGTGLLATRYEVEPEVDVFRVGIKFKVGHDYHWAGQHYEPAPPLK